jgi:uncharacterized membrane-anchored protein
LSERAFDPAVFDAFPADWLAGLDAVRVTSISIRAELREDEDDISQKLSDWFVSESVAVSRVLDDSAIVAADFRIDETGHQRVAIFADKDTGERRLGRIIQRLCEIETYKSLSMQGFATAREIQGRMGQIDA